MSCVFMDGFDGYATAQLLSKWTSTTNCTISSTAARSGGNGLIISAGDITKSLPNQATYIVGFAFNHNGTNTSNKSLIYFLDGGTIQIAVQVTPSGTLQITRGSTNLGNSTVMVQANVFHYMEVLCTVNSSTGVMIVKLDGAVVLNLTGQNTQSSGAAQINGFVLNSLGGGGFVTLVDDVYVNNALGTANNSFSGDVKISARATTGSGSFAQFTRGGTNSGANWSQVNDAVPDGDTSYNQSNVPGNRDSFTYAPLSVIGSVLAVQYSAYAEKDDTGSRSIALVARSSTTDNIGATQALAQGYTFYMQIFETDPNTSAAWTATGLNAAEFGYELVS